MNEDEINLVAPINSLSYGITGTNLALQLGKISRLSLFPIGNVETSVEDQFEIESFIKNGQTPDLTAPCVRLWHQHDMSLFVGRGSRVGFPIFELDMFTYQERLHLNSLDFIFTCSEWGKGVILNNINIAKRNVIVIPLGVNPQAVVTENINKGPTKFFTCGKWEIRKGHDFLVKAFSKAFSPKDDVELHMMCDNVFLSYQQSQEWKMKYANSPMGSKVRFIPRVSNHNMVLEHMRNADCGIFLSRAEGWNLGLLEMMSLGKSVIATNYSGHTEYCNSKNTYLVETGHLELAVDNIWFHGQGQWAHLGEGSLDQTIAHMREVHNKKQSGNSLFNSAGVETANEYSWENSAKKVLKYVKAIH